MGAKVLGSATFSDRRRVLGLLVRRGWHVSRRIVEAPLRAARRWRETAPDRLLIAPQDIRTGDPTIAADIGAGYFAFAGKIVETGEGSPFAIEPASDAWARYLNDFGWLRHLRTADDPRIKQRAGVLVDQFLQVAARPAQNPAAWEIRVAARRMLSWMSQSPIILEGGDHIFYSRFMAALTTLRHHLEARSTDLVAGETRLLVAIALAEFGLCGKDLGAFQHDGTERLALEIKEQILPDGGHVSRDPQVLIDLLLDLLPLRQAYAARGVQMPSVVLNAIDRMMPMLRLFRHGDGTLALFNGMGVTAPEFVATILAYDDARARPMLNAPQSGYQRLQAGDCVVVVDAGPPPPRAYSSRAHAGCLSFEFSSGAQRIVVNCGAPDASRVEAREAARATAAHSTLVLDDTSSCRLAGQTGLGRWLGDEILAGPTRVTVARDASESATTLHLSHDGYAARFGFVHARDLSLESDGSRFEGRDALEDLGTKGRQDVPYALRFHLHPAIEARLVGDDERMAILLDCPDGDRWLFQADAPLALEPSVLFASGGGPRPTRQIRIAAPSADRKVVNWAFRRRPSTQGAGANEPAPPIPDTEDTETSTKP